LDLRERRNCRTGWRRLRSEELHNVYASPNIVRVIKSRKMRGTVHVARMVVVRNSYKVLDNNIPRCTWEDNIKMDLREIGWEGLDWMHLVQSGYQ
jgi:hypothetical protein